MQFLDICIPIEEKITNISVFVISVISEAITVKTDIRIVCFVKVKEKDTAWFVKFCVPWCKHW